LENSNCRASDDQGSKIVDILMQGESAELQALNPERTHGKFLTPNLRTCWIWLGLMEEPDKPLERCEAPVEAPPEPPPTDTPVPACSPDMDQEACETSGGVWSDTRTGAPRCVCP
jgi:hypothetical protein